MPRDGDPKRESMFGDHSIGSRGVIHQGDDLHASQYEITHINHYLTPTVQNVDRVCRQLCDKFWSIPCRHVSTSASIEG